MTRTEVMNILKDTMIQIDPDAKKIIENCSEDSDLSTDLGLDSIEMLSMVIMMEENHGIDFSGIKMSKIHTVKDVIDYIVSKK